MKIFEQFNFYLIICFSFCVYNLSILISNGRKSVYQVGAQVQNLTYFSICLSLKSLDYNCDNLDPKSLIYNACSKIRNLSIFFESNQTPRDTIIEAEKNEISLFYNFTNLVKIIDFNYYLNFHSICIAYTIELNKKVELRERSYSIIPLINLYKIESKILFHNQFPPPFITRGYFFECVQFSSCPKFSITIRPYNLKNLQAPFKSNCKNYFNMKFSFKNHEKIITQSHCLFECLKKNHRLSFFYYSKNDNDLLKLNSTFPIDDKMKLDYKRCSKICSNIDCSSFQFFVFGFKHEDHLNYSIIRHHYKSIDYTAIPFIYQYSLVLQFFGLISLVFGTSFLTLLIELEKAYYENQFLKNVFKFETSKILFIKKLIFSIIVTIGIYFEIRYFILFINDETNISSILRAYTPIYPTIFTLISCFKISTCLPTGIKLDNISLRELEFLPSCELSKLTSYPKVRFSNDTRELKMLNEKTIYRIIEGNYLKCFQMKISVAEPRYRSVLFGTDVFVNTTNVYRIYLTDHAKKLNNRTNQFRYGFKIRKAIKEIRFKNCTHKYNYKGYDCSKYNCIDYCYNLEFVNKYKTIPFHSIIYSEYFRNKNNLKFNLSFNYDSNIWSFCESKFKLDDCDAPIITSHDKQIGDDFVFKNNTLIINLMIEHIFETIILITNQKELIFHILTLGSVLFSLSALNLFIFLIKISKLKFLNNKYFLFFLSLIGFIIHNYHILDDSLNSELISEFSNNFEFLEPNKELPIVIFCAEHGVDLSQHRLLTGHELNRSSSNINKNSIFKEIVYYDLEFRKQIWYPYDKEPINLKINYFFINNYKCFELEYYVNTKTIYSTYAHNVLEIKINENFDRILFTYRANQSYNLVDYFIFKKNLSYYCNFEFIKEKTEDRFLKIKKPLLLVQENLNKNDVKDYINNLRDRFKLTYNFTSTSIPLFESDFDYEIRNDLFEDFIEFIIEPEEQKLPENKNFQRNYFNAIITYNNEQNITGSDTIYIKKVFFQGDLYMSNKDDYLALIINLLNALSIWFNLSLIDLVSKFNNVILYFKKLFYKFKNSKIEDQMNENEYLVLRKTDKQTDIVLIDNDQVYYLE